MLNLDHVVGYIDETVSEYPRQDTNVEGGIFNRLRIPYRMALHLPAEKRPALLSACKKIAAKYGCELHWDQLDILIHKPLGLARE